MSLAVTTNSGNSLTASGRYQPASYELFYFYSGNSAASLLFLSPAFTTGQENNLLANGYNLSVFAGVNNDVLNDVLVKQ